MKANVVVLSVCLFVFTQAKIDFNTYEDECISELNADKNEISDAFNQNLFPEDNEMFKEVLSCAWKKEGIIDQDGNMVLDNFRQFLITNFKKAQGSNYLIAALVAADTIHHCEEVKGNSPGDTAVKMSNCILRRLDSYGDDD